MFTTLVVAATLAAPLCASAQVSASGTFTNFSYTLVDLLPNDGIAPSLSIVKPRYPNPLSSVARADINQSGARTTRDISDDKSGALYSRPLDASLSVRQGAVTSTISGGNFQSLNFDTAASTTGSAGYERSAFASSSVLIEEFVLSPGTQISFFADASGSVATSLPRTNRLNEDASVGATMSFAGFLPDWYPDASATFNLTAPRWSSDPNLPFSQSASQRLSIMFQNTESSAVNMKLSISMFAKAASRDTAPSASPVPEPSTYGMLIGGLALVAGAARRKRAANA
ncbi:PEP-CTERM sorting domain-containing protein [Massilia sp. CCM 8693]|uniref:PEP-CTERM sorting domain-containing protein n=2 Tax=Massilia aquatica TaxID=2609000 RepID=A0ABX0MC40_9BURK|nr:PEP-CTERM sorting domain-containing protein [Massilia aquatica]